MITDSQTNKLYLADCLPIKYPRFYSDFKKVLQQCNIPINLLPDTKDIWAVDYMPIQVSSKKFIQFDYNPDYLQKKTKSDVDNICNNINLKRIKSDIILDGGNVIRATDKVILCEKIFIENPHYNKHQLTYMLKELFEVDILCFIPQQPNDFIGHADGMVRFLDDNTVIINDYSKENTEFHHAFKEALEKVKLSYIEIPYNPYDNKKFIQANGIYINFLQMQNTLIIPTFGKKEDEMVFRQLEQIFDGYQIATVDSNSVANEGGVLKRVFRILCQESKIINLTQNL